MGERRLAAIAVVDVAGYSRMMAEDEEGTLAALRAHTNATEPILFNHGGRLVKRTGDGMVFEVPSVVEALRASVETQKLMAERNAAIPEGRRMRYRIGLNLGDVIVDDDGDLYGDGVNVAARLEGVAEPGSICLADSVYRQVKGHVEVQFDDLGMVEMKNLPDAIHAWSVSIDKPVDAAEESVAGRSLLARVVVLPFSNMSGDPEQEYFADGITEDLITALSHHADLSVISRSSSFAYKDHPTDVRSIGRELDATHVVEGSVRKAGNRVRVTGQLIEAESGGHVWAENYDRELDDVFELQDEMVAEIAGAIRPSLEQFEGRKRASSADLTAWDLQLRARSLAAANTGEDITEAISLLEKALAIDPDLPRAHSDLSSWWVVVLFNGWHILDRNAREEMRVHGSAALQADPRDPWAHAAAAWSAGFGGSLDEALDLSRRSVSLGPHDSVSHMCLGTMLLFTGSHEEAIQELTEAWRLGRHEWWNKDVATNLALAHYLLGRFESSIAWSERGLARTDYLQTHIIAAAGLAQLGRAEEAAQHLDHLFRARPGIDAERMRRGVSFWRRQEDIDHYLDGLTKAGLPESSAT